MLQKVTKAELKELADRLMAAYNAEAAKGQRIVGCVVALEENGLYYAFIWEREDGAEQVNRLTPAQVNAMFGAGDPGERTA